jgi:AraC family transcriptional regulator
MNLQIADSDGATSPITPPLTSRAHARQQLQNLADGRAAGGTRDTAPVNRPPEDWITRRSLYQGRLFEIGHIVCRPTPEVRSEVEYPALNVLALPTAGVFALHHGPRRQVIATPNHAVFIASGSPCRVSFPGNVGDECIVMRMSPEGLARLVPESMARDGFKPSYLASHATLPPAAILARGLLWRHFGQGDPDPLLVEELGIGLLEAALGAARKTARGDGHSRHVRRVKEAISAAPERKWTLGELSCIAGVSPCHLAHVFNREIGTSVYRYAVRQRLARALNAVLDSNLDLTSIALDAGFASHSHFTARFRAFFGLTPERLRKSAGSGSAAELRKIVIAEPAATA